MGRVGQDCGGPWIVKMGFTPVTQWKATGRLNKGLTNTFSLSIERTVGFLM